MKVILQDTNIYILRFDTGENVIESLTKFCSDSHIFAGTFSIIGAAQDVVLSYYHLETKQYEDKSIHEDVEITGIIGTIAVMNEKIIIHCHGTFSNKNFEVIGGHVKKIIVSATCEVNLHVLNSTIERVYDKKTGLNLMR